MKHYGVNTMEVQDINDKDILSSMVLDAISKDGGQKITSAKDILSSRKTREVATIGSTITVIQELFGFRVGEEMM